MMSRDPNAPNTPTARAAWLLRGSVALASGLGVLGPALADSPAPAPRRIEIWQGGKRVFETQPPPQEPAAIKEPAAVSDPRSAGGRQGHDSQPSAAPTNIVPVTPSAAVPGKSAFAPPPVHHAIPPTTTSAPAHPPAARPPRRTDDFALPIKSPLSAAGAGRSSLPMDWTPIAEDAAEPAVEPPRRSVRVPQRPIPRPSMGRWRHHPLATAEADDEPAPVRAPRPPHSAAAERPRAANESTADPFLLELQKSPLVTADHRRPASDETARAADQSSSDEVRVMAFSTSGSLLPEPLPPSLAVAPPSSTPARLAPSGESALIQPPHAAQADNQPAAAPSMWTSAAVHLLATLTGVLLGVAAVPLLCLAAVRKFAARLQPVVRVELTNAGGLAWATPPPHAAEPATSEPDAAGGDTPHRGVAVDLANIPLPLDSLGPTFDDQQRAEQAELEQQQQAILQHVFDQNLALREQLCALPPDDEGE